MQKAEARRERRLQGLAKRRQKDAEYDCCHLFKHCGTKLSVRTSNEYTHNGLQVVDCYYTATFYFMTDSGRARTKTVTGEVLHVEACRGENGVRISGVEFVNAEILTDFYG